jgi:shikimate kinase
MVVLVVGPSGVGKSDYGEHAQKAIPNCEFIDLDSRVRERWAMPVSRMLPQIGDEAFLCRCQQEVRDLMESRTWGIMIVAVGAGALQSHRSIDWIAGHLGPTIAVVAAANEVYRRGGARNRNRCFEEFVDTEYSEHRKRLYATAKHRFDVSGWSVEEARNRFVALIRGIAAID